MQQLISRAEARALGLKQFYTGRPCKRGHLSQRNTLNSTCLDCIKAWHHETYSERRDAVIAKVNAWTENNRERSRENKVRWVENNPEKVRVIREAMNTRRNAYRKTARRTDPSLMIMEALRGMTKRICKMTGKKKNFKTAEAVGYSIRELKFCMELQFQPDMTWENHGEWHIDHVKPIAAFIREGVTDVAIINSLGNLQPLWAVDNLRKRDKWDG
jgi:hypothetical protein